MLSRLRRLLARSFSVQAGEGKPVLLVAGAYFLVFGGSIIGRNARDSLFLKNFGVGDLPFMYAISALLVGASATLYTSQRQRIERRRFLHLCFAVFCGLLVASRLVLTGEFRWFYPVLYIVSQAVSIVSGMLFWTATGELFDLRQAKRLVPIVTAGSVLGMIVCGFLTKPLVRLLGTANLLLVWVAMLVCTLLLLLAALRRYALPGSAATAAKPRPATSWTESLKQGFTELASTRLLRAMAMLALANTVVFMLVDFQFSQVMTETYRTPDELTSFLGTFRGLSGILGLVIQLGGTAWLISRFGVGVAIAVEPFLMVFAAMAMALSLNYGTAFTSKFIDNTLFFTVQGSAFQLLFNPLPPERRARNRAFLEGYFRPLLTAIGGLLLVAGNRYLTPRQISILAAGAAAVWLATALKVRRGYLEALVENLGAANAAQRLSAADALAKIKDPDSLARLAQAIRTAPAESAVPAILLLERFGQPQSQGVLVELLDHPEVRIRATAVAALGRLGNRALVAHLKRLLQDPDPRTRANAVEASVLADAALRRSGLPQRLEDPADRVRANALAVLNQLHDMPASELLPNVEEMAQSPEADRRASAAYALGWFPAPLARPLLLKLLDDAAPQPRARAVRSLELVGDAECVPALMRMLSRTKTLRREGRLAVLAIAARQPEETFAQIVTAMRSERADATRLGAHLLGRLERMEALPHLVPVLSEEDPALREEALQAIERLAERHPLAPEWRAPLEVFVQSELGRLEHNLARRQSLLALPTDSAEAGEVADWLAGEMLGDNRWMRRRVLGAAALLYDAARVREVARGVDDPDPRKRANALEALEYVAPGGLGKRLARYLEMEAQTNLSAQRRPTEVLLELIRHRYATFRAATVLLAGRGRLSQLSAPVEKCLVDPAPIVREAAVWAAARFEGAPPLARLEQMKQDSDARVRRSAEAVFREAAAGRNAHAARALGSAVAPALEVSMLLTVEKVLFLKSVPLFASLEGEQVAGLAEIAEEMNVEAGRVIFKAGERGDELYMIISGRLKVYRGKPGSEVALAELGSRECFGEMALLDSESRSASVATLEPCRLLKIRAADFRELLFERPQISMEILKILARRLRRMDVEMEERLHVQSMQQYM